MTLLITGLDLPHHVRGVAHWMEHVSISEGEAKSRPSAYHILVAFEEEDDTVIVCRDVTVDPEVLSHYFPEDWETRWQQLIEAEKMYDAEEMLTAFDGFGMGAEFLVQFA